jgi:hypothetical protein
MDVSAALIAHPQAAELMEPGERAFHDPAVDPQTTPVGGTPFSQHRFNPASPQGLTMGLRIIPAVTLHAVRFAAGTTDLAAHGGNRRHQREELGDIVAIGAGERSGQGEPVRVGDYMMFTARFAPIGRVGAGLGPPKTARTEALSTTARDQSSWSAACNLARSTACSFCHTPARCHCANRRQHVIPEPQPISWGNNSQGIPLRSTNRMPVKAWRLSPGLRPGKRKRRGLGGGKSGAISFHRASSSRGVAMCILHGLHMDYRVTRVKV